MGFSKNIMQLVVLFYSGFILAGCEPTYGSNNPQNRVDPSKLPPSNIKERLTNYKKIGLSKTNNINNFTGKGINVAVAEPFLFVNDINELAGQYGSGINFENATSTNKNGTAFAGRSNQKDLSDHGTKVSSVLAGKSNGLAPGAKIYPYVLGKVSKKGSKSFSINQNGVFYTMQKHMISNSIIAVNNSWGGYAKDTGKAEDRAYIETVFNGAEKINKFVDIIQSHSNLLNTGYNAAKNYPIWVFSAGNTKTKTDASTVAKTPTVLNDSKLEKYWLVAGGFDAKDGKRNLSPCGSAKAYCISAPAEKVSVVSADGSTSTTKGTSFSAPMVVASLALLKQAFPLSDVQKIRERLLKTASHTLSDGTTLKDKDGTVIVPDSNGLSSDFGRGAIRLDTALSAQGTVYSASGNTVLNSAFTPVKNTKITPSVIFGSGIKTAFKSVNTYVFDSLGGEFKTDMAMFISAVKEEKNTYISTAFQKQNALVKNTTAFSFKMSKNLDLVANSVHSTAHSMGFAYTENILHTNILKTHFKYSYMANSNTGLSKGLYMTTGISTAGKSGYYTLGKNISFGTFSIRPALQTVLENGSVLGMTGTGALSTQMYSATNMAKIDFKMALGNFSVFGYMQAGNTYAKGFKTDLISNMGTLHTQSYGLYLKKQNFGFGGRSSMRITKGNVSIKTVESYDINSIIKYTDNTVSIVPVGKERIFETFYTTLHPVGKTRFSAVRTLDKNHTADNDDTTFMAQYSVSY